MNWEVVCQILVTLLVSGIASILVFRLGNWIASLSPWRVVLLCAGLLLLAFALAISPSAYAALLPSPKRLDALYRLIYKVFITLIFDASVLVAALAVLIGAAPKTDAHHDSCSYLHMLGPTLGVCGFVVTLVIEGGTTFSGVPSGPWVFLCVMAFPSLLAAVSVLSSRLRFGQSSALRLLSMAAGFGALNYSISFSCDYFEGILKMIMAAPK
jgi:hypothetical protein